MITTRRVIDVRMCSSSDGVSTSPLAIQGHRFTRKRPAMTAVPAITRVDGGAAGMTVTGTIQTN